MLAELLFPEDVREEEAFRRIPLHILLTDSKPPNKAVAAKIESGNKVTV